MLKLSICLLSLLCTQFTFASNTDGKIEVTRSNGRTQQGVLKAVELSDGGAHMPYVEFKDGTRALFGHRTDMAETFCLEVHGLDVFNPYRDLRMGYLERNKFKTSIFGGYVPMIVGNNESGYKEEEAASDDMLIRDIGCSTY